MDDLYKQFITLRLGKEEWKKELKGISGVGSIPQSRPVSNRIREAQASDCELSSLAQGVRLRKASSPFSRICMDAFRSVEFRT